MFALISTIVAFIVAGLAIFGLAQPSQDMRIQQSSGNPALAVIPCGNLPTHYDSIPPEAKPIAAGSQYLKDANNVYLRRVDEQRIIPDADLNTFKVTADHDEWGMDKAHVYYAGCELAGADPNTFEPLPRGSYGKDTVHVYWRWYPLNGANARYFKSLPGDYGKDETTVYVANDTITGADATTFESFADKNGNPDSRSCGAKCWYSAQDKNYKYSGVEIVQSQSN